MAVLLPVCMGIITDAGFAQVGYGPSSAARSILLPIYIAIALFSVLLLFMRDPKFAAALLPDESRLLPGFGYNGWNWPIGAAQETTLK